MLAGPYAGMVLADLGAEVVKVEPLGSGEMTRGLLKNDPNYSFKNFGAYFLTLNRIPLPIPDTRNVKDIVKNFEEYLVEKFPKTKVLAISQVTTTTGATLPIKEITSMAHSHGVIVIIDGAQAFGMNVNVTDLGVDVYATSAHKWILAPTGNGILYIKNSFHLFRDAQLNNVLHVMIL